MVLKKSPYWEELTAGWPPGVGDVLSEYEALASRAGRAFEKVAGEYGGLVRCGPGCDDCCHAVFGLFLVESFYLAMHFHVLDPDRQGPVLARARCFEGELARALDKVRQGTAGVERLRVRCPFLGDDRRCVVYAGRPVTCRVYGIPTAIAGRGRVCGRSGFERGGSYPAFKMDRVHRELHRMSAGLLAAVGRKGEDPGALFAVSRSVTMTPVELLGLKTGQ